MLGSRLFVSLVALSFLTTACGGAQATQPAAPDLTYAMVKAMVEDNKLGKDSVTAQAFGGVRGIEIASFTVEQALSPMHPGAAKYFEEIGLKVPKLAQPPKQ